ncbi:Uncharacterised protein [Acinetobacter baumannii]|nr:hypothetical protein MWMV4_MWMV4_02543 [Acinetobacter baumannii]SSM84869.1 Uncharacterised protein [Acinetobacter baumannii]SSM85882.1 Uncharacterised protein [Acinetobacter baumannii]SSO27570.1 Uncharacterised protein [Acinetobacter baumannii]SSS45584.1 Uncharacterised protein [Acinetobacter baumannii]
MLVASAGMFFRTPVIVTLPAASDALITLSAVTESIVKVTPAVFGAAVSTVTTPVSVPTLPAASVAVTVMVCGPSVNAGSVLSASVQVPSPLFTAG